MGSIKDKVAIVGMGCTKFGERWDAGPEDLMVEAFTEAIEDAGIEPKDIEAAWSGTQFTEINQGVSGLPMAEALKLPFIPVTHVENMMMATRYFARYGLSPKEGKTMLAKVSAKSHHNGALCEKAHLRREVSVEQIMNAPIIAWPLGLFDCCGVSDGSAVAIVVRADMAKKFRPDPVYVKALQIAGSSGEEVMYTDYDYTHVETTTRAAARAYEEAGIKNPREEISMAEVHDCFSITEAVTMEDLQFSPRGKVKEDIDAGRFNLDGEQPIQTDGGLKCFGHPIGASGLRMMYEEYKQLQGKCGQRQVKNPKLGMTHNLGGFPSRCVISTFIVGL